MRARILLVPFVAAAALLAGCTTTTPQVTPTPTALGLEAKSADEILAAAQAALDEAKSFRVKGPVVVEETTVIVDLVFAGSDVKGTMTILRYGAGRGPCRRRDIREGTGSGLGRPAAARGGSDAAARDRDEVPQAPVSTG